MSTDEAASSLRIEGEWLLERAADLRQLLVDMLDRVASRAPGSRVRIDLSGVTNIDACCCQLLAVFLADLKRRGLQADLHDTAPKVAGCIDLLGFAEALASAAPGKKEQE